MDLLFLSVDASSSPSSPRGIDEITRCVDSGIFCPGAGNCECFAASSIDAGSDLLLPFTGHSDILFATDGRLSAEICSALFDRENQRFQIPGFDDEGILSPPLPPPLASTGQPDAEEVDGATGVLSLTILCLVGCEL